MAFHFPEDAGIVLLSQSAADSVDCDHVCTKNVNMLWFVVTHTGANDTDLVLSLYEGTTADDSGSAVTTVCPTWIDADAGTSSDQVAKTTSAYSWTIDPATQNGVILIIQVDPAILSDGESWVYLSDSGGHGSNLCSIHAVIDYAYKQPVPPTVIA